MYEGQLTAEAAHFFEQADGPVKKKLDRCFAQLAVEPHRHPNIKSLAGRYRDFLRYRVGDWRVVYEIREPSQVLIMDIAHRREVYDYYDGTSLGNTVWTFNSAAVRASMAIS